MSGSSLIAIALRDRENDDGSDPRAKLRAEIAKGNLPEGQAVIKKEGEKDGEQNNDDSGDEGGDDEEETDDEESDDDKEKEEEKELTEEEKAAKAEADKLAAKAKRKEDRVQKRFNELTAARTSAEAEVARLKAQLEADPEKKLTEEEIETRAEAKAAQKQAAKDLAEMQTKFEAACDKLQADARKVDKDFDDKINDIATDVGPIPSFMIGVLEDLDNGGEVLAFIANDDELAERIYSLKTKPAKMTKELVEISNKLETEKKKPKKQISKVPDPVTPVKGGRANNSLTITEADTKDMATYVRKRQAQMLEARKLKGFG